MKTGNKSLSNYFKRGELIKLAFGPMEFESQD